MAGYDELKPLSHKRSATRSVRPQRRESAYGRYDELKPLWHKRSASRPTSAQAKAQLGADRRVTERPRDGLRRRHACPPLWNQAGVEGVPRRVGRGPLGQPCPRWSGCVSTIMCASRPTHGRYAQTAATVVTPPDHEQRRRRVRDADLVHVIGAGIVFESRDGVLDVGQRHRMDRLGGPRRPATCRAEKCRAASAAPVRAAKSAASR